MAYKIKGKWTLTSSQIPEQTINFYCKGIGSNLLFSGMGGNCYYFDNGYNLLLLSDYGDAWKSVDFNDSWQTISKEFYDWMLINAISNGGEISDGSIVINITSPEGITLATEKTIVNSNIKVTIDESLLGNDTSDATASADSIFEGETAYIAEGKVTGTFTIDSELTQQDSLIEEITNLVKTKATSSVDMTSIEEKYEELTGVTEDITFEDVPNKMDDVYVAGQYSAVDESKIIEKTVTRTGFVILRDVSEVPHKIKVQLHNESITDFADQKVQVI